MIIITEMFLEFLTNHKNDRGADTDYVVATNANVIRRKAARLAIKLSLPQFKLRSLFIRAMYEITANMESSDHFRRFQLTERLTVLSII
jgi:hypothetical protein